MSRVLQCCFHQPVSHQPGTRHDVVSIHTALGYLLRCFFKKNGKCSPYSITECRVPELIPVLGSQPAGDVNHKPSGRLSLLSARPAVTLATLTRAATNFYRLMLCIRGTSHGPVSVSVCLCLCLCLSVTSRSSTKTAKRRITQTTPHDSPGTLVF